jgi:hypothetical protein
MPTLGSRSIRRISDWPEREASNSEYPLRVTAVDLFYFRNLTGKTLHYNQITGIKFYLAQSDWMFEGCSKSKKKKKVKLSP